MAAGQTPFLLQLISTREKLISCWNSFYN